MVESSQKPNDYDRRTSQLVLAAFAAGVIVTALLIAVVSPWWRHRLAHDFWPIDSSPLGAKLAGTAVQALIAVVLVAVFWPPLRRRIIALVHTGGHRANEEVHARMHELHAQMAHIIKHHPDIPHFEHGAASDTTVTELDRSRAGDHE